MEYFECEYPTIILDDKYDDDCCGYEFPLSSDEIKFEDIYHEYK